MSRHVIWTLLSVIGGAVAIYAAIDGNDPLFWAAVISAWSGVALQWADQ